LRHLLRSRLGVVDLPGDARTRLAVPFRLASRKILAHARLAAIRLFRRHRRSDRTRRAVRDSPTRPLDGLPPLPSEPALDGAHAGSGRSRARRSLALVHTQLRTLPPLHSRAQRLRTRTLHRQQRLYATLGQPLVTPEP